MDIFFDIRIVILAVVGLLVAGVIVWKLFSGRKESPDLFEDMEGHEFESVSYTHLRAHET